MIRYCIYKKLLQRQKTCTVSKTAIQKYRRIDSKDFYFLLSCPHPTPNTMPHAHQPERRIWITHGTFLLITWAFHPEEACWDSSDLNTSSVPGPPTPSS